VNRLLAAGLLAAGSLLLVLVALERDAEPRVLPAAPAAARAPRAHSRADAPPGAQPATAATAPDGAARSAVRPAAAAPAAQVPPVGSASRPPRWSDFAHLREQGARELEYLELYRAFARGDAPGFRQGAGAVVLGEGPINEKTALLRAAFEVDREGAQELFRATLIEPTRAADGERLRLREFALRFLGERCDRDAPARELLREAVWSEGASLEAPLRRRTAARLASVLAPDELGEFSTRLLAERDATVVEAALAALAGNPRTGAPPALLLRLGYEPDAFQAPAKEDELDG